MLPLLFCKSHEEAVLHLQLNQYGRIAVLPGWEQGGGIMVGRARGLDLLAPFSSFPVSPVCPFTGLLGVSKLL